MPKRLVMPNGFKLCGNCNRVLQHMHFDFHPTAGDGYRKNCKRCVVPSAPTKTLIQPLKKIKETRK